MLSVIVSSYNPVSLTFNVDVVVAIGSTSVQAFKMSTEGVIPLLPISQSIIENPDIHGNKTDPNLSSDSAIERFFSAFL